MNKSELIDAVGDSAGLDRRSAERAVNAFVDTVTSEVRGGNKVTLIGFGTFTPKSRGARMGRNPRTGEPVRVKASKSVGFSPGSALKAALNTRGGARAAGKSTKSTAKSTKAGGTKAATTKAAATKAGSSKAAASKASKSTKAPRAAKSGQAAKSTRARAASKPATGRTTAKAVKAPARAAKKR